MITEKEYQEMSRYTQEMLATAGITLTEEERQNIEVADFGLGNIRQIGLQVVTYVNTQRVCAKELVLAPWQLCPQHAHVDTDGQPGKEETFRCRRGTVYLYVDGEPTAHMQARMPASEAPYLTVRKEIILKAGQQYTLMPNTRHWFQAGAEGAVVSEFSTRSTDETDVFTNPNIIRAPCVAQ